MLFNIQPVRLISSMFDPMLLFAKHEYTPKSCSVTASIVNKCLCPPSCTSARVSVSTSRPFRFQDTSAAGWACTMHTSSTRPPLPVRTISWITMEQIYFRRCFWNLNECNAPCISVELMLWYNFICNIRLVYYFS